MCKLKDELRAGALFAKTDAYKKRLNTVFLDIESFFEISHNPYVSLSWGKQSIVLAHMVFQVRPETPMLFLRSWESYLLHDYERVINQFPFDINYIECYKDNVSWNDWSWQKTRDYGSKDIQTMADEFYPEWDGVLMGLSKDESVARRITTSIKNTDYRHVFRYKDDKYRCTPISRWTNNDLAAYIATNRIRLLSTYESTGLSGRTTARITRNNAEMNGLVELKRVNMPNYNTIVSRFPELSIY